MQSFNLIRTELSHRIVLTLLWPWNMAIVIIFMVSESTVFKMPGHSTSQIAKHWPLHRLALFRVSQCYSQTGFTVKQHWPLPESRELTMSSVASPSRPRMRYTIGIGSPWNNTEQPWKQGHQLSTEQHKTAMETLASSLHNFPWNTTKQPWKTGTTNLTERDTDNLPHWQRHWLTWMKQTTYLTGKNTDWYRQSRQPTSLTETKIDANKADNLPHWQRHLPHWQRHRLMRTTYLSMLWQPDFLVDFLDWQVQTDDLLVDQQLIKNTHMPMHYHWFNSVHIYSV